MWGSNTFTKTLHRKLFFFHAFLPDFHRRLQQPSVSYPVFLWKPRWHLGFLKRCCCWWLRLGWRRGAVFFSVITSLISCFSFFFFSILETVCKGRSGSQLALPGHSRFFSCCCSSSRQFLRPALFSSVLQRKQCVCMWIAAEKQTLVSQNLPDISPLLRCYSTVKTLVRFCLCQSHKRRCVLSLQWVNMIDYLEMRCVCEWVYLVKYKLWFSHKALCAHCRCLET